MLGELVRQIAAEHGYEGVCSPDLAGLQLVHVDQTEESDLNLLYRLAREHDATFKAAGGRLIFTRRGSGRSAGTATTLPAVVLRPGDVTSGRVTHPDRPQYDAVRVRYHDAEAGGEGHAQVGGGESVYEMRFPGCR